MIRTLLAALAVLSTPVLAQSPPEPVPTLPGGPTPGPEIEAPAQTAPAPPRTSTPPATPEAPPFFDIYGEFAVEYGGDDVIELLFTDGGSQTLTAGQGGTVAAGVRVRPMAALPISVFGSVGYKFVLNASENADIRLTRIPIEIGVAADITPDVWAEAAFTHHAAITLHGDDFFEDTDFDAANGATVAAGWKWVGVTYTAIRYTAENGTEFDASNVGATLRVRLSDF